MLATYSCQVKKYDR